MGDGQWECKTYNLLPLACIRRMLMSVIDAANLFITGGHVSRWQPGEPYGATGTGLAAVLNDAIDGKPFFVDGSLITHSTIINSYVKELFELAREGLLRRAIETEVTNA